MKKVMITGARGFIGSALCRKLLTFGVEVHAVSRRPSSQARHWRSGSAGGVDQGAGAPLVQWTADLVELEAVRALTKTIRPDVTIHLASQVTGSRSLHYVVPVLQNNLLATVNLLTASSECGANRVVLAGSFEEPDEMDGVPCSPYAAAKWAVSGYARMFGALYQSPIVTAKIYMVYGPDQPDQTKLVPYVITSLLRGDAPKLSSGTRVVDWVFVDDVVDGLIGCGQTPGIEGCTVELGSGVLTSIRDVVAQLSGLMPNVARPQFGVLPDRPFERSQKADISRSYELIGWRPHTRLPEGLARTVDWYRAQCEASSNGRDVCCDDARDVA